MFFLWQTPFLDFIVEKGNKKQIERYVSLENRMLEVLDNEKLKKVVKDTFARYRSGRSDN